MVVDLNTHTHNAALACLQRATGSAAAFASTSILFTFGTSETQATASNQPMCNQSSPTNNAVVKTWRGV